MIKKVGIWSAVVVLGVAVIVGASLGLRPLIQEKRADIPAAPAGETAVLGASFTNSGAITDILSRIINSFGTFPYLSNVPYQIIITDRYESSVGTSTFSIGRVVARYGDGNTIALQELGYPYGNWVFIVDNTVFASPGVSLQWQKFDANRSLRFVPRSIEANGMIALEEMIYQARGLPSKATTINTTSGITVSFNEQGEPTGAVTVIEDKKTIAESFVSKPDIILFELPEAKISKMPEWQVDLRETQKAGVASGQKRYESEAGFEIYYPEFVDGKPVQVIMGEGGGELRFTTNTAAYNINDATIYCNGFGTPKPHYPEGLKATHLLSTTTASLFTSATLSEDSGGDYFNAQTVYGSCNIYTNGRFRTTMFKIGAL